MLFTLVSIIKRYSCHINPGLELVNTYYYEDGLWHRITGIFYNWRTLKYKNDRRTQSRYCVVNTLNHLGKFCFTSYKYIE